MKINNINPCINFGKRVPIAKCNVENLSTNSYEIVTISELDCDSTEDANIMDNVSNPKDWRFRFYIKSLASQIAQNPKRYENERILIAETDTGKLVGLANFAKDGRDNILEYIESDPSKQYKYIGQSLMAALGHETLKNKKIKRIYIPIPVSDAMDFYKYKCDFNPDTKGSLYLKSGKINKLINQTWKKSNIEFIKKEDE